MTISKRGTTLNRMQQAKRMLDISLLIEALCSHFQLLSLPSVLPSVFNCVHSYVKEHKAIKWSLPTDLDFSHKPWQYITNSAESSCVML